MQYGDEIALLRDGLSLRRVRSRTGRAINTLRKLRTLFLIWIIDPASPILPNNLKVPNPSSHLKSIPPMTTVPTYAHLCNRLSPDATCRNISTLESLSAFFGVMQPDNRMTSTPFSKIRKSFRSPDHSKISRGVSRLKDVMNSGWMGYGEQPDRRPSKVEIKTSKLPWVSNIFRTFAKSSLKVLPVKIWDKKPIFVP